MKSLVALLNGQTVENVAELKAQMNEAKDKIAAARKALVK